MQKVSVFKILPKLLAFVFILGAILFIAAGRWNWMTGWAYMALYAGMTIIGVLVVPLDPGLVEERTKMKMDVKEWDKRILGIGTLLYPLAIYIVAGLDERYGWSSTLGLALQFTALGIAAGGNLLSIWATAVNKFYSRFVRIQRDRGHIVISVGPYRYIRHPGYLGQITFSIASALALDSVWALIPGSLFAALLVTRTELEDKTLQNELEGYREYAQEVRFRLIPYVW